MSSRSCWVCRLKYSSKDERHRDQDGNGHLARILTTLLLLRASYEYVPYISLESVIEHTKEAYYVALRQTQVTITAEAPNWQPWLEYFLRALVEQKSRLEMKIERERIFLSDLPELSERILELCRERGRVTIGDIAKRCSDREGAKSDFVQDIAAANAVYNAGDDLSDFPIGSGLSRPAKTPAHRIATANSSSAARRRKRRGRRQR